MNKFTRFARIAATVITIGGLALVASGCGSTATHPHPAASKTAPSKVQKTAGLSLADATNAGYIAKFPLVNCSTLSASAQAQWKIYLAGSQIGKCAPADFLTADVPTITASDVRNFDKAISKTQAVEYAQAMVNTLAWQTWAAYGSAPAILAQLPLNEGPLATGYEWLEGGGRLTSPTPGEAAYPSQISIIPLTASQQTIMADTDDTFAVAFGYPSFTWKYTAFYPTANSPVPLTGKGYNAPQIFTGSLSGGGVLGNTLSVTAFDFDCSSDAASGLCSEAGVS